MNGELGMMRQLPVVELLGKNWYVDERLKEFRNVDNPHLSFSNIEMDDLLELEEVVNNPKEFGLRPEEEQDRETLEKLTKLFDRAKDGDKSALEEIAEMA